jgi:2-polyprenyl-6-methoxyphenol hydroxylase-like FAD-dependent oxidoreductase
MSIPYKKQTGLRVIVIGGGIGGLCLAQGLKKSNLGVAVHERDLSARFRSQGYRLTINAQGS